MLVIDHLSQVLGDVDENTSAVAGVMANLRGMAESLDLSLILIHHQIKGVARFGVSSSDALRGHGSILASCDLALHIERQTLDPLGVNVKPVAVRGPGLDEFAAKFAYEQKSDGSLELQSARFFGVGVEAVDAEVEAAIVLVLQDEPDINQTLLRQRVNERVSSAGDPTIRGVIARMERDGRLKIVRGKQNAKLYSLTEASDG